MDWRLVREEELRGAAAMAYDEVAAETVAAGGPATVRVYRWVPSTVSLGYGNDASIVDWDHCAARDVDVTRRPTGGGAIYHDTTGDVAYSIIAPADEFSGDVTDSYRQLLEPVLAAFERAGVDVDFAAAEREAVWQPLCYLREVDPAHDLTGPDGRKIAGNAQYRTREAIVQHGSLTFHADAEKHLGCFVDLPVGTEDFDARVCGADEWLEYDGEVETGAGASGDTGVRSDSDLQRSRFVSELEDALAEWADATEGEWTDDEQRRTREFVEAKYGNDEWVRERNDPMG